MLDLSLFEALPLEGPKEEVVSSLGDVYHVKAIKGVQDLLKNATPFKMTTFVSVSFFIPYILNWYSFVIDLSRCSHI